MVDHLRLVTIQPSGQRHDEDPPSESVDRALSLPAGGGFVVPTARLNVRTVRARYSGHRLTAKTRIRLIALGGADDHWSCRRIEDGKASTLNQYFARNDLPREQIHQPTEIKQIAGRQHLQELPPGT